MWELQTSPLPPATFTTAMLLQRSRAEQLQNTNHLPLARHGLSCCNISCSSGNVMAIKIKTFKKKGAVWVVSLFSWTNRDPWKMARLSDRQAFQQLRWSWNNAVLLLSLLHLFLHEERSMDFASVSQGLTNPSKLCLKTHFKVHAKDDAYLNIFSLECNKQPCGLFCSRKGI